MSCIPITLGSCRSLTQRAIRRTWHLLSYHPERILRTAIRRDRQLRIITSMAKLKKSNLERISPISLLAECWGRSCPNNRLLHPCVRKEAAKVAATSIQHIMQHYTHATCIFYGSGALLQELIVLHLAALQITHGTITIIFVDPLYAPYVDFMHAMRKDQISLSPEQLTQHCTTSQEQIAVALLQMRLFQSIRWCTQAYPHIKWNWYIGTEYTEPPQPHHITFAFDVPTPSNNSI